MPRAWLPAYTCSTSPSTETLSAKGSSSSEKIRL
jgi:hypothetical protein